MNLYQTVKFYAGAANMHRRPDAFKSIALISSPALAPESNVKAETGVGFNPFRFLKLSATIFYTRWSNIIALRNDTATPTDITNTNIYYNAGASENTGIELGGSFAVWQVLPAVFIYIPAYAGGRQLFVLLPAPCQ